MTTLSTFARVPYYSSVAIFAGLSALVAYINNTQVQGWESDVYLVIFVLTLGLCGASIVYLFTARSGADDDDAIDVAGLQFGKTGYYTGVILLAFYRIAAGYLANHVGGFWGSTWGVLWILGGLVLLPYTYANYRSYTARRTIKPVLGERLNRRG